MRCNGISPEQMFHTAAHAVAFGSVCGFHDDGFLQDHHVKKSSSLVAKISKADNRNGQKHVHLEPSWKQSLCLMNAALCRVLNGQGPIKQVVHFHVIREPSENQPQAARQAATQSATKVDCTSVKSTNPPRSGQK